MNGSNLPGPIRLQQHLSPCVNFILGIRED